jgi:hypothetical protein
MPFYCKANRTTQAQPPKARGIEVPSPTPETTVLDIALDRLALSPGRRRKMNYRSVQALAARIQTGAQIQSLIVVPTEDGQYYVVAGERRLAALQLLLKQGRIGTRYPVACRLINAEPVVDSAPVLTEEANLSYSVDHEKRRRFKDLRNRCPGLITASELALRRLTT